MMKRRMIAAVCAALLLVLLAPMALAEGVRYEGEGYATAEEACRAYLEAYNAGDVQGMLSTFAIETYVEHLDRKEQVKRLSAFMMTNLDVLPMPNDFLRDLLVSMRLGELSQSVYRQYLYYAWPDGYGDMYMANNFKGQEGELSDVVDEFYSHFDQAEATGWVGNVELVGFLQPGELGEYGERFSGERTQENIEKTRVIHGSDEIANMAMYLRLGGVDYIQFMQCERYGEKWYNTTTQSVLSMIVGLESYAGGLLRLDAAN